MTERQYLEQIQKLDTIIKNRQTEISQLWDMATNITAPIQSDRIQTSETKDRIGKITAKIADLEFEKTKSIDEFMEIKENAIKIMEALDRVEYGKVLFKRYIEYKPLNKISSEMNYSYRHAKRIHQEALYEFGKVKRLKTCPQMSPNVP